MNRFVELLSGSSGTGISNVGIKLGFAYAVGAASAVNPCGFAMLPAYLGLYVSGGNREQDSRQPIRQVARAIMVGLSVSVGFVALFGLVGLILGLGSQAIVVAALPYVGLVIGVLLIGAGSFMAGGGKIYTSLAQRAAARIGDPGQLNLPGYVLFGVSYGLASLSCTLPLFLAVLGVGAGLSSGWLDTLGAVRALRRRHGERHHGFDARDGGGPLGDGALAAGGAALRGRGRRLADGAGRRVHHVLLADHRAGPVLTCLAPRTDATRRTIAGFCHDGMVKTVRPSASWVWFASPTRIPC